MKKLLFLVLTFSLSAYAFNDEKIDQSNPYKMVNEVANVTFKRFAKEQPNIRANPNILKDIVREELIPYTDYRYAAFKVVGSNLKYTTEKEREEFVPAFRDYFITSYAQVFTLYNNQKVEFEPAKTYGDEKILAVGTVIIEDGRPPINIVFKVRKDSRSGEWRAFDMVAEGVSLLDSKQAELASIIRQQGLAHVTAMLKEKSQRDIVFKD